MVNLTVVKTTGHIIYPGMTWNSLVSWLLVIVALPSTGLFWLLISWCTYKKTICCLKKHKHRLPNDLRIEVETGVECTDEESIDGDNLIQQ